MIKAVIFDWGHVLIDNSETHRIKFFSQKLGVTSDEFKPVLEKYLPLFTTGELDEDILWLKIQEDLGIKDIKIPNIWAESWETGYIPFEEMWSLARALKANGYKIGLLSNCEKPTTSLAARPEYGVFDAKIFSCFEGVKKPDSKIYEIALERLGVKPEEAVFIDDVDRYVEGAKIVGLRAIHHDPQNPDKTIAELKSHGVKS